MKIGKKTETMIFRTTDAQRLVWRIVCLTFSIVVILATFNAVLDRLG